MFSTLKLSLDVSLSTKHLAHRTLHWLTLLDKHISDGHAHLFNCRMLIQVWQRGSPAVQDFAEGAQGAAGVAAP
jgi:hypothetical protein